MLIANQGLCATPWQLAFVLPEDFKSPEALAGAALNWRDAQVPGNVQCSAFGLPLDKLYQRTNVETLKWMEQPYWVYRTEFSAPALLPDQDAVFLLNGVDYRCQIVLNGKLVLTHEGMFSPISVPLAGTVGAQELLVIIEPFPEEGDTPQTLKARYSMGNGWDFAPKLQARGIWDSAGILVRDKLRIVDAWADTTLANQQRADLKLHLTFSEVISSGEVLVELDGITRTFPVIQADRLVLPFNISSPTLWWPNGRGEPNMVLLRAELKVAGRRTSPFTQRLGLRAVERVACAGQKIDDTPLQFVINGQKIFIKGVNWVPADACPGTVTVERYKLFLEQFRDAGVNLIRVWGGGLIEKSAFYELADEYGIMVIQEFPLACQKLERSERFLRLVTQEVIAILRRLRHHPCIVLWTGGNEHYHYWDRLDSGTERMTRTLVGMPAWFQEHTPREWRLGAAKYDEPVLALMGELVNRYDGTRPYQITSAMEGEGEVHGIWTWNPAIGDHRFRDYDTIYDYWLDAHEHFYSECSVSGVANLNTMAHVLDGPLVMPTKDDYVWRLHHAFCAAWDQHPDLWLDIPSTEAIFGKIGNIEGLYLFNQWLQGEGGRFLVEELRRKCGRVGGVIWWGVNEPWPGLAGNALIDYFGRPKLAWRMVANAFKPTILSLRYRNCVARRFKPELWISHDGAHTFSGRYEVEVLNLKTNETDSYTGNVSCPPNGAVHISTLVPEHLWKGVQLHVTCRLYDASTLVHRNDYFFGSIMDRPPFTQEIVNRIHEIYVAG